MNGGRDKQVPKLGVYGKGVEFHEGFVSVVFLNGVGDITEHSILIEFKTVVRTMNTTVRTDPAFMKHRTHMGAYVGLDDKPGFFFSSSL